MLGQVISHYRLLRRLGAGGMGEVYEAEDMRLGRHAALKFLPDAVAQDEHALERFDREARAASSLDHPNICTIYEIGEQDGHTFLAMQLLEGQNLRERLTARPASLDFILDVGTQIADALDAAHSQGIIHRDIKPSNIFITSRGQAKLLDFGLAKVLVPKSVTAVAGGAGDSTTVTQDVLSSADSVLGTVAYMSPEQALGKELDCRTDLFSLGAVLYEMATGVTPFPGTTSAAIFDSILNRQPVDPLRLNPTIPEELDHIIRKALEKDREVRYQTASEIRADLKRLKRDSSSDKVIPAAPTASKVRQKSNVKLWAAAAAVAVALAIGSYWLFSPLPPPKITGSVALTHDSIAKMSLVTDGSRIYFSEYSGGRIILAQVSTAGGETSAIATPFQNSQVADISPDRSQLLVGTQEGTSFDAPLWSLPLPSGPPRRLGNVTASSGAWSPDGRLLAFANGNSIFLARADGADPRLLIKMDGIPRAPRFSPDSERIRFTNYDQSMNASSLWEVRTDGSHLRPLFPGWHDPARECCGVWTADGRYYIFVSGGDSAKGDSGMNIFAMPDRATIFRRSSSKPVQLTTGPLFFYSAVPSQDAERLFVLAIQPRAQLVRYDLKSGQFVPYLSGISATDLAFSPDGQWIAYVTIPDGTLWRSRLDGSERLQLTFPPTQAVLPVWSPDGTRIAYEESAAGKPLKAQLVSSLGGVSENLLPGGGAGVDFNWSPDGNQIIFSNGPEDYPANIQILDIHSHQVTVFPGSEGMFSPRRSPDGRYLAAITRDSRSLMLYDFRTKKWSKWLTERGNIAFPTWSEDSKFIYFDNFLTDRPTSRRAQLDDSHSEELFSLAGLREYSNTRSGVWGGLAPDNSRLYVQDLSAQEIYALDLKLP